MSIEDKDELAQEFAEFGYRETFDPKDADRRNFYKVEKWDWTFMSGSRWTSSGRNVTAPGQASLLTHTPFRLALSTPAPPSGCPFLLERVPAG
jgi:hypothetical protein